jgi:hypothetical protein
MTNAPHVVGRSFEQLIMFPLGLVALLAGVAFLFGHEMGTGKSVNHGYGLHRWGRTITATQEEIDEQATAAGGWNDGAGDGDRTRDIQLGKLAFYR